MPATPRFKVSQTDNAVIVRIKVPHVRVGSAETHVDGREFSFYCKPYLLRLTLPLDIAGEEDGSCTAVYDPADDNGTITATLAKATPGVHFPDLDLTTTLLQPRWTPADLVRDDRPDGHRDGVPASSGVEVISSEQYGVSDVGVDGSVTAGQICGEIGADSTPTAPDDEGSAADGGGHGEGKGSRHATENVGRDGEGGTGSVQGVEEPEIMIRPPTYGFNDKFSGFFTSLRDELKEMIHLADPDNTPRSKRRELRLEHEKATFDADRYLGDLFTEEEDPLLTEALAFEPHWKTCRWAPPRGLSDKPPVSGGAASSESKKREADGSGFPMESQDVRRVGEAPPTCTPACVCETPTRTSSQPRPPPPPPPPPSETNDTAAVPASQPAGASSEGEGPRRAVLTDGGGGPNAVEVASSSAEGDGGHAESGEGVAVRETGAVTSAGTGAAASAEVNNKEGISSVVGEVGWLGEEEGDGARDEDGVFAGFTEVEEEQMRRLPNREYLIPAGGAEEKRALLGLADILFAYAYDHRTTVGDATVESPWTIAVLSPLLTWLETPEGDVDEACVASAGLRRSLIFPYLRVWELGTLLVKDVRDILSAGKRCVLRCLLQTYAILERGEVHYLLNKLFIEDYCVWIQKASEASLAAFAERYAVAAASTTKSDVRLDLERIEAEAAGVAAPASAAVREVEGGGYSQQGDNSSEESSEEGSEDSSEDGSEESSSEDDSSSSGEEETSSEEEEEEAEETEGENENNMQEEADGKSTSTPLTNEAADGSQGAIAEELAASTAAKGIKKAVRVHDQDRVKETTGSSSTSSSTSFSVRTGSRVERSSDLLHLESRVDNGAGRAASVVTGRLSSLSLEPPRGPLSSVVRATGGQKSDASGRSEGSGVAGAGDSRRKNMIEEL